DLNQMQPMRRRKRVSLRGPNFAARAQAGNENDIRPIAAHVDREARWCKRLRIAWRRHGIDQERSQRTDQQFAGDFEHDLPLGAFAPLVEPKCEETLALAASYSAA